MIQYAGQALELGSDEIADMIESLSVLFRYTISQRGDILTFEQELKNVDHYIKIQQYRFENRFVIRKKIDGRRRKDLSVPYAEAYAPADH